MEEGLPAATALADMIGQQIKHVETTVYAAYVDLWSRYQALLHVVSDLQSLHPEQLETRMQAWAEQHQERLLDEARTRLAMLAGKYPSPPV